MNPSSASRRAFLRQSAGLAAAAAMAPGALGAAEGAAPAEDRLPRPAAGSSGRPADAPRAIHPYPNQISWGEGRLRIAGRVALHLPNDTDPAVVAMMAETWRRFTADAVSLEVSHGLGLAGHQFVLISSETGTRAASVREPGATYSLRVDENGAAANAADPAALRHAWFSLLQLLQAEDNDGASGVGFALPQVSIQDRPALAFRGLHLCVFPETPALMIEKAIRLAAFLKFSHVVLEFWGMLRLEAMKELSWPEAWSKAEAGRLLSVARGMGLEVIPMFNCWGHAAASRISYGRHVVLDQNPRLATLFEPDGWTWCLSNPRARELIRRVCDELIEFGGPGGYFHIGCDEAYSHATCDRCRGHDRVQLLADHINTLAAHLEKRGRRPIMWGDALLERAKWPRPLAANGTPELPTHEALKHLSRRIVIADWHYDVNSGGLPTLAHFRSQGFEALACPWNTTANIRTLATAAKANGSGLLMTTWHHLVQTMPKLAYVAAAAWSPGEPTDRLRQMDSELVRSATATLLRKLVPAEGHFDRAGWNPFEMPAETN